MIVDCAVYEGGRRCGGTLELSDALEASREDERFVWIGLYEPADDELAAVAREFELHELAVEDAIKAHQRPKLESYGEVLFLVLKTASYDDEAETIELGEIMVFLGESFVITVRHGSARELSSLRARVEADEDLLRHGPGAVLHSILDTIVDEYQPVVAGLENDIDEVEATVFSEGRSDADVSERIYKLKRQTLAFSRATGPLVDPVTRLSRGEHRYVDDQVRAYFRDVHDHLTRIHDAVEAMRDLLTSVLDANLAQVSVRQNEDMRKISAWVAIAAIPTAVAGIYGMNFEYMPELEQPWGYPAVLLAMAIACALLFRRFKRVGWL